MEQPSYANKSHGIDYGKHLKTDTKESVPLQLKLIRTTLKVLNVVSKPLATRLTIRMFLTPKRVVLREEQMEFYDFGESFTQVVNDRRMFMFKVGDQPQVLLVHGWGSSSYKLRHIMQKLHEAGISFLTFDQPANGMSPGKRTNFYEVRKIIAKIVELNPTITTVIGHSFGGAAAYQGIQEMEQHNITKLVLLGSPSRIFSFTAPFFKLLQVPEPIQARFNKRISEIAHLPISYQAHQYPQKAAVQKLLVHDHQDYMAPFEDAEQSANHMDNARLIATDGMGHRGILRDNYILSSILEFVIESNN